jgi:predicted MFS family arabinose efflux permease
MTLPLERQWKNVSWLLSVEVFWGVSLSLISMVAVLPVFLNRLGATNTVLGVLPVIWLLATNLPGAFAAHFTGNLAHRKRAVILFHILAGIPWVLLAIWFGVIARPSPGIDIAVFLAGWGASWVIQGFTIPIWINFIGKVTRPELRARSFGTIFFFQTLMGAFGGWVGSRVLGSSLPFPQNYALGFLVAGAFMAIGSFFFIPVREDAGATSEQSAVFATVVRYAREILSAKSGIRVYLAILILSVGRFLLITYYPVFAEDRFSLKPRDSAIYTSICMAGQMIGSIVAGVVGDRYGYARVAVVAMAALTVGLVLAIWGSNPIIYYLTAFVLGIFIISDILALFNLSMAFSPHEDNTAYVGIIPALVAPVSAVVAGSSGFFIDHFGFIHVAWFGLAGAVAALYLVVFHLREPAYSLAGKRGAS